MKKDIINKDKNGNLHGEQIYYHTNNNISRIENFNHGLRHGYQVWFNYDTTIAYKEYWNMYELIYEEDHEWSNQIRIKI